MRQPRGCWRVDPKPPSYPTLVSTVASEKGVKYYLPRFFCESALCCNLENPRTMIVPKIHSTVLIITAIGMCSTTSLPLHSLIETEDASATMATRISTPWSVRSKYQQMPTPLGPMGPIPDYVLAGDFWSLVWFAIMLACLFALYIVYFILKRLLECCRHQDLSRKLYCTFRDNVCCGCCVRKMRWGMAYEYEEI